MNRTQVAVIEDDDDLRDAICLMLRYEGYEPAGFPNGREALRRLENGQRADVILLDLMMPAMSGWEFCEYRAIHPTLSRIPVILITARRTAATAQGVNEVLLKPFGADDLHAAISRVLAAPPSASPA